MGTPAPSGRPNTESTPGASGLTPGSAAQAPAGLSAGASSGPPAGASAGAQAGSPAAQSPSIVPGDIFVLPPRQDTVPEDTEYHRHMVLIERTSPTAKYTTLVFASSSTAEVDDGARCHPVEPLTPPGSNGLTKRTYFHGGVLVRYRYEGLTARRPSLTDELDAVRDCVRDAIGYGSGPHYERRYAERDRCSWRGRIIRLKPKAAGALRTPFAVVLTSHDYSCCKKFQTVVPLLVADEREPRASALRIERPWVKSLLKGQGTALLAPGLFTRALWHDTHVQEWTAYNVDPDDLKKLEQHVCDSLGLPLRGASRQTPAPSSAPSATS